MPGKPAVARGQAGTAGMQTDERRRMNKPFFEFADNVPPAPGKTPAGANAACAAAADPGARAARPPGRVASRPAREGAARQGATAPAAAAGQERAQAGKAQAATPTPAAPPRQPRMSTAVMLSVFALSALVGGAAAGLMLALMETDSGKRMTAAVEGAGIVTPLVRQPMESASGSGSAVLAKRSSAPVAPAAPPSASSAGVKAAGGNGESSSSPAASTPASSSVEADAAGAADLARLTNQVVAALSAMNGASATEGEAATETAAVGAERLRQTLAELVNAAQAQGRSDEEIRKLVAEALDSAGEENIPAILRDASGKVNVQRLLASVMPARRQDVLPKDSKGLAYFRQLEAEADITSTDDQPPAAASRTPQGKRRVGKGMRKASGRFFIRNGKRYTIIRKGDTLSDIAYAAYGDVLAYPAILRANRGRISVRNLKPGTRILIPDIGRKARRTGGKVRRRGQVDGPAATRRKAVRKNAIRRKPAAPKEKNIIEKIITLPASGAASGTGNQAKPVKVMNFRSQRDARPLPIAPRNSAN